MLRYPYHDIHFSSAVAPPHHSYPPPYSCPETAAAIAEPISLTTGKIYMKETAEAHVIKMEVPGLKREEVKVELEEGNTVKICGEKIVEKEERNGYWYRVERRGGRFVRSIRLPENANGQEMKACLDNGVLFITVPKCEMKKTRKSIRVF